MLLCAPSTLQQAWLSSDKPADWRQALESLI
jgi:hypothetical protein